MIWRILPAPVRPAGQIRFFRAAACAGRGGVAGLEPARDQSGHGAVVRARAGHVLEQDLLDAGIDAEQFSVRVEHGNILRACLETHLSIMKRFNSMLAMAI